MAISLVEYRILIRKLKSYLKNDLKYKNHTNTDVRYRRHSSQVH